MTVLSSQKRATAKPARWQFLDATRGVAASTVAVGHFFEASVGGYLQWGYQYLNFGRAGVAAFFLVSGYVIPVSAARSKSRDFWISRGFRLFPGYWTAAILAVLCGVIGIGSPVALTAWQYVANLTLLQQFVRAPNLGPIPAWTLAVELIFYLQSSVLSRVGKLDRGPSMGYAWLGIFVLAGTAGPAAGFLNLPITVPLLLFIACLGQAIYRWERGEMSSASVARMAIAGVVTLALVSFVSFGIYRPPVDVTVRGPVQWSPVAYSVSCVLGVAVFLIFFVSRRRRFPRAFLAAGAISYSLYLTHPIVYAAILRAGLGTPVSLALYIVCAPLVAFLLYRTVENGGIALGRKLARRDAPIPAPALEASG